MKRILIAIVAIIGVGGLIGLLTYNPKSATVAAKSSGASKSDPASPNPSESSSPTASSAVAGSSASPGKFKDGTYTGQAAQAEGYGPVQIQAVVTGGKLTSIKYLQMPSGTQHSQDVTSQAEPILQQEALQAQSASIDTVSGATQDTQGFEQSLSSALNQAQS